MASALVDFLEGVGVDHRGRRIETVLAFDDAALESVHDYIQWLFPLPDPSAFNPFAPVLSGSDITVLKASDRAQVKLRAAAERMQRFYEENRQWLRAYDHNHLRITRIIRSLFLLVGQEEARSFYGAIEQMVVAAGNPVAREARQHWKKALVQTC